MASFGVFLWTFEVEKFPSIESIISGVDLKSYGIVSIAWTESLMRLEMGTSWILGFLKTYIGFLKLYKQEIAPEKG